MNLGYCELCQVKCDTQACTNKKGACIHLCGPCRVYHGYQYDAHGILDENGNLKKGESSAERQEAFERSMNNG